MTPRSSIIGFIVGVVAGITVVMQSSVLLSSKHHLGVSLNEHHAKQTRNAFVSSAPIGRNIIIGEGATGDIIHVPEPTTTMMDFENIRATNLHRDAGFYGQSLFSSLFQSNDDDDENDLDDHAGLEPEYPPPSPSSSLNEMAHTWLKSLRGCYPLSQSCDMNFFWETSNDHPGPWNRIGEIDIRRDLVMWVTPPTPAKPSTVPNEWMKQLSNLDPIQMLKQRQEKSLEAKATIEKEKNEEMEGGLSQLGTGGLSEEAKVVNYLTENGCSKEMAHQLTQPYYSQVEMVVEAAMSTPVEDGVQVEDVLSWTVTDGYAYADVIPDMADMVQRYKLPHFLFVALDHRAAAIACSIHAHVVLLDEVSYPALRKHSQSRAEETKAQVEEAKFGTSAKLASLFVDAFFLEMDCWMLRNPLPLFTAVTVKSEHFRNKHIEWIKPDMVISVHQENYMDINAGIYFVRGNERTRRLFQNMLDYILSNPGVWDQSLMSCLVKRESQHQYLSNHDGCDRKGITTAELNASSIIENYNIPTFPQLLDPFFHKNKKSQFPYLFSNKEKKEIKEKEKKAVYDKFTFAVTGPDNIVSGPYPFIFEHTTMVHVLTDKPLTSAHGKKLVAKELGLWEGANSYYCIGGGETKRYLAYEGLISTDVGNRFHDQKAVDAILLHLVALALITDRVLVLPHVFDAQRQIMAWQMMDISRLTDLGIKWREATFLHNPRLELNNPTLAHALVSGDKLRIRSLNASHTSSTSSTATVPGIIQESLYEMPAGKNMVSRWHSLWATLSYDDLARGSDLLFVNFDERDPAGNDAFELQETRCFGSEEGDKGPWGCRSERDGVPELLLQLRQTIRFCMTKSGAAPRQWPNKLGLTPGSDCFTFLEREQRLLERNKRLAAEDRERREQKKKEKEGNKPTGFST